MPHFLTEHVEVNNLSGRIGEQIVDVPVADIFCRSLEVKPAVTHLSESTSSMSMCWCVSEALACLLLPGEAVRGSFVSEDAVDELVPPPNSNSPKKGRKKNKKRKK